MTAPQPISVTVEAPPACHGAADTVAAGHEAADPEEAVAGDKTPRDKSMKAKPFVLLLLQTTAVFIAILLSAQTLLAAEPAKDPASKQSTQKSFDTPQQAVETLIKAAEAFDVAALKEILGPGSDDIVSSDDPVQDQNRAGEFVSVAKEKNSVEMDKKDANKGTLLIGQDDWPFPIPLVKRSGKWIFDTKAGRDEILIRRIGRNELDVMAICRGFVEAQHEYAAEKHDNSPVNQYAQKIISTAGKHDGLAWQNPDGTWGGPVGEKAAQALDEGYTEKAKPYHGYFFKVLTGQGPNAPMGQMDFVLGGAMIGGFALAAAPAEYKVTGVKTFMVSHSGVVYEKDLGPDGLTAFKSMQLFNPDKTWAVTDDQWPDDEQVAAK
jgi:Protein of unknown function (DUF2950)